MSVDECMGAAIIKDDALRSRLGDSEGPNYSSVSAAEYRYKVQRLLPYLSEEAFIWYKGMVETAVAKTFANRGIISRKAADEIAAAASEVTAQEVYAEDEIVHHDIVALVNRIRSRVSEDSRSAVHRAATSCDIIDTANALRFRDAFEKVILPDSAEFISAMIEIVRREKDTLQIGRSHLQHGEPITFGFSQAWFLDRFGRRVMKMKEASEALVGKFSGAMGAYNAQSLFVDDPMVFEREVLGQVNAASANISSQIVQPEFVGDLIHFCIGGFSVLANWADDVRNLMRPELGEVSLPRGKDVSTSSTMPHKQNPVGLENIKSLWKEAAGRVTTRYMDMISENARDLTNSASQRFIPEIFDLFDYAVTRGTRIAKTLQINPDNMKKNFEISKNTIPSEPLQLLLSAVGLETAHVDIGRLADRAAKENKNIVDVASEDEEIGLFIKKLKAEQVDVLSDPRRYTGRAEEKAMEIADKWEGKMKEIKSLE
jgi:adenylosuccinate lyase